MKNYGVMYYDYIWKGITIGCEVYTNDGSHHKTRPILLTSEPNSLKGTFGVPLRYLGLYSAPANDFDVPLDMGTQISWIRCTESYVFPQTSTKGNRLLGVCPDETFFLATKVAAALVDGDIEKIENAKMEVKEYRKEFMCGRKEVFAYPIRKQAYTVIGDKYDADKIYTLHDLKVIDEATSIIAKDEILQILHGKSFQKTKNRTEPIKTDSMSDIVKSANEKSMTEVSTEIITVTDTATENSDSFKNSAIHKALLKSGFITDDGTIKNKPKFVKHEFDLKGEAMKILKGWEKGGRVTDLNDRDLTVLYVYLNKCTSVDFEEIREVCNLGTLRGAYLRREHVRKEVDKRGLEIKMK